MSPNLESGSGASSLNGGIPVKKVGATGQDELFDRAGEVKELLDAVQELFIPFIKRADDSGNERIARTGTNARSVHIESTTGSENTLIDHKKPTDLIQLLNFELPDQGRGKDGLLAEIQRILKYSVNTWDQGFLDKLYASTNAVGVVSELLLAVLNTNLHVYHVSPALSLIERHTARHLANMFGFNGPYAGGVTQPGGSASNLTSLLIARNTLFPDSKVHGNAHHKFCIFTSEHSHYSLEKAAMILGLGTKAVIKIPVDYSGRMRAELLEPAIIEAKQRGFTPFYINATAGTTVLGAYDPIRPLAAAAKKYNLWLHVDGSWGGSAIFSRRPVDLEKLDGVDLADSITINPHKMLNVPVTCSFLLGADTCQFQKANSLDAGYLFHEDDDTGAETDVNKQVYDLADLTLQCGRKGDAVKMALGWIYHGKEGYAAMVENIFTTAERLAAWLEERKDFKIVGALPAPQCGQVCFYYLGPEHLEFELKKNSTITRTIVRGLVARGFMIDYAPGDEGDFIRVVVNAQTRWATVIELVTAIDEVGKSVLENLK